MSSPAEPDRRGQRRTRTEIPECHGGRAVVGFDGTTASHDALAYAVGWARRVNGQLSVLYVPDDCWRWIIEAGAVACPVGAFPDYVDDLSEPVAGTVADHLGGTNLTWSYHTARGGVARALNQHAAAIRADAIIIGRSHRRLPHPMRTSIAHRLLSHTDRIVIVVP